MNVPQTTIQFPRELLTIANSDGQLEKQFNQAISQGLWFYTPYQDMWFSPEELCERWAAREMRWGSKNWVLRNPSDRIRELEEAVVKANSALIEFKKRVPKV